MARVSGDIKKTAAGSGSEQYSRPNCRASIIIYIIQFFERGQVYSRLTASRSCITQVRLIRLIYYLLNPFSSSLTHSTLKNIQFLRHRTHFMTISIASLSSRPSGLLFELITVKIYEKDLHMHETRVRLYSPRLGCPVDSGESNFEEPFFELGKYS